MTDADVTAALTRVAHQESGRVLALLARYFGDLDLADDSVADALAQAAQTWPEQGVPDNPPAWLLTVARNRGIDRIRRRQTERRNLASAAPDLILMSDDPGSSESELTGIDMSGPEASDDHLRLLLLCCHPALNTTAQVALTLRLVGGLTTPEIAAAFVVPEATLAQRIVRAKRKIRDAAIPLSIPADLSERTDALLRILYLIFNEGYLPRGISESTVRTDLAAEAIRLTEVTAELLPDESEVKGLLALELFQFARFSTRTDAAGDLVLLADQDRTKWDLDMIQRGNELLNVALQRMQPGPFQLQAVIASFHANAPTAAHTNWIQIERAYGQLAAMTDSPVVAVNHAVAVSETDGPLSGLKVLETVSGLDSYYLFYSTRAELLLRADRRDEARADFDRAAELTSNLAEQRHLLRRSAAC